MVAGFKIKEIELRSEEGTRFSPKALTIIVGPNNAGKSRFLKEVRSALLGRLSDEDGGLILGRKIISTIELLLPESTGGYPCTANGGRSNSAVSESLLLSRKYLV